MSGRADSGATAAPNVTLVPVRIRRRLARWKPQTRGPTAGDALGERYASCEPGRMATRRLTVALITLHLTLVGCGPSAAGVGVCSLEGDPASDDCAAATVSLSDDACRCGVHYFWDGASCVSTAACRCFSGCEQLYETQSECVADHASCLALDAGPRPDGS